MNSKINPPSLYIFSGLPGSGKSTLAIELAKKFKATYLRIDIIEQALRDVCKMNGLEGEGYRLSYRIAKSNLECGNSVIADSVNPWKLTRDEWNSVAKSVGARSVNIEVVCSDRNEHRKRIESRAADVENLILPSWEEVIGRDYQAWDTPRIHIDTSGRSVDESFFELIKKITDVC